MARGVPPTPSRSVTVNGLAQSRMTLGWACTSWLRGCALHGGAPGVAWCACCPEVVHAMVVPVADVVDLRGCARAPVGAVDAAVVRVAV